TTTLRRTIRRHELHEMVPPADSTIYEMEQRGEFPRRFALSPRCVVWDLSEVEAWLLLRRSKPLPRAPHPDVKRRRNRPVKVQDGNMQIEESEGLRAVCHPHEIDQLDGQFWINRLSRLKRERLIKRFEKMSRGTLGRASESVIAIASPAR